MAEKLKNKVTDGFQKGHPYGELPPCIHVGIFINVNIKMYIFDHLRMYIFAILPLDRYIFLSDKIFL